MCFDPTKVYHQTEVFKAISADRLKKQRFKHIQTTTHHQSKLKTRAPTRTYTKVVVYYNFTNNSLI